MEPDEPVDAESEWDDLREQPLADESDIEDMWHPQDDDDDDPFDLENESNWVINGIITLGLSILVLPLLGGFVEELDAVAVVIVIVYVVYTAFSGEAIDPPHPKKPQ
jgi:hypothetical protein